MKPGATVSIKEAEYWQIAGLMARPDSPKEALILRQEIRTLRPEIFVPESHFPKLVKMAIDLVKKGDPARAEMLRATYLS